MQIQIIEARKSSHSKYSQLIQQFSINDRAQLVHALQRTAALEYWGSGTETVVTLYLSKYDEDYL